MIYPREMAEIESRRSSEGTPATTKKDFLKNLRFAAGEETRYDREKEKQKLENETFSEKVDNFCEGEALSGFKFFHSSYPVWFRFIWILFMALFVGMMVYQLVDLSLRYSEEPLTTEIKTAQKNTLKLPNVLICPYYSARLSKAGLLYGATFWEVYQNCYKRSFSEYEKLTTFASKIVENEISWKELLSSANCSSETLTSWVQSTVAGLRPAHSEKTVLCDTWVKSVENMLMDEFESELALRIQRSEQPCGGSGVNFPFIKNLMSLPSIVYEQFLDEAAFTTDEFVVKCSYGSWPGINCKGNISEVTTAVGRCFLLNMTSYEIPRPGIEYALDLELNVANFDHIHVKDHGAVTLTFLNDGDLLFPSRPVQLSVGYNAHIPLKVTEDKRYRTACSKERLKVLNQPYSHAGCMLENFVKHVEKECGCTPFVGPGLGIPTCSVVEEMVCVYKMAGNSSFLLDSKGCLPACMETGYDPMISYGVFDFHRASTQAEAAWKAKEKELWNAASHITSKDGIPVVTRKSFATAIKPIIENKGFTALGDFHGKEGQFFRELAKMTFEAFRDHMAKFRTALEYHGQDFVNANQEIALNISTPSLTLDQCVMNDSPIKAPLGLENNRALRRSFAQISRLSWLFLMRSQDPTVKAKVMPVFTETRNNAQRICDSFSAINHTLRAWSSANESFSDTDSKIFAEILNATDFLVECLEQNRGKPYFDLMCDSGFSGNYCLKETELFITGITEVTYLRDRATVLKQYEHIIHDAKQDYLEWELTVLVPFLKNVQEVAGSTANERTARFMVENFPEWKRIRASQRSILDSVEDFLQLSKEKHEDYMLRKAALNQWGTILRITEEEESVHCFEAYLDIWNALRESTTFLSQEWLTEAERSMVVYSAWVQMSDVGELFFRENVATATLYLSDMTVKQTIQTSAYDFWTMLYVGGTISFYVGGTIITFFEIIFTCSEIDRKKKILTASKKKKVTQETRILDAIHKLQDPDVGPGPETFVRGSHGELLRSTSEDERTARCRHCNHNANGTAPSQHIPVDVAESEVNNDGANDTQLKRTTVPVPRAHDSEAEISVM